MTATRQAAWRSGPSNGWHDDLIWYAAGVHQMRLRTPGLDDFFARLQELLQPGGFTQAKIRRAHRHREQWSDLFGLGYHSQIHGTFVQADRWPQINGNAALWKECAHNHWFFLPWHRAYLLEFEAVCRAHIIALEGPAEWGLPYWNYSDFDGDSARLGMPLPLRGETLPTDVTVPGVEARADGMFPNPLWIPGRSFEGDSDPADNSWANASTALLRHHFANQEDTGRVSFGGGVIEDATNQGLFHDQTTEIGQLDASPHGSVHVRVNGAMALFETAGLDPVFWLHHCNVDRLWETYARDLAHGYPFENGVGAGTPAQQSWNDKEFWFLRADDSFVAWTAPSVLDLSFLDYCVRHHGRAHPAGGRDGADDSVGGSAVRARPARAGAGVGGRDRPTGGDDRCPARRRVRVRPGDDRRGVPRRGHLGAALRRHPLWCAGADVVPGVPRAPGGRAARPRRRGPLRRPAVVVRCPGGQPRRRIVAR